MKVTKKITELELIEDMNFNPNDVKKILQLSSIDFVVEWNNGSEDRFTTNQPMLLK